MDRKPFSFIFIILLWFSFVLLIWFGQGNVQDILTAFCVITCGISTIVFWIFRDKIKNLIKKWNATPKQKFLILGSLGAIYVEFVFWIVEKLAGYDGLAAHPNFLINLLITMT